MKTGRQVIQNIRRLVDSLNVPILLVNPATNQVEFVNTAFEDLTALERKKVRGTNLYELFAPDSRERVVAICEVMSQAGPLRLEELECELLRRSGRRVSVNLVASPVVLAKKKMMLISAHDLTSAKRLQMEREINLKEVAQISKLADIGMLAAGVAHELNNPLMIVQGFAENMELLLSRKEMNVEELKRQAKQIQAATERMGRIIRQMSRIVRSGDVQIAQANMKDIVHSVLQFLDYRIKQVQVQISVEIADGCLVKCDHSKIEQVILNILSNAIHALETCSENDRQIRIRGHSGKWVDLEIWNNGPIIPKGIQERVMTPFFTTKEVGKGTGLGLPVSVGILKAHGGSLRFQSEKAKGIIFTIRLPRLSQQESAPNRETEQFVLMVNADSTLLEKQVELANRLNFQVAKAQSAMEAYQWLQGNYPLTAVFIHIEPGNPDSLLLIQHIRQVLDSNIQIVAFEQIPLEFTLRRQLQGLNVSLFKVDSSLETMDSILSGLNKPRLKAAS